MLCVSMQAMQSISFRLVSRANAVCRWKQCNRFSSRVRFDGIVADYPHISREGVLPAIRYAAETMRKEVA
jgi:hypothetical protein